MWTGFVGAKQFGFGNYEQSMAKMRTRRERFLSEMEAVVPWKALIDLIEPHYPRTSTKGGRPPYPLETMLRIHLLQQWYDLSDPAMEDALLEVATMRRFADIALITDRIPDETTILAFRHLLEEYDLRAQIYEEVKAPSRPTHASVPSRRCASKVFVAFQGSSPPWQSR
jgi:IS5 family transposase